MAVINWFFVFLIMLKYLIAILFMFSAAFAATGVLLSRRLRFKCDAAFLSTHFYFLIFMLTFGAYGLWGQVLIRGLISTLVSDQAIERISGIVTFIGLPFLTISWYMLIKMSVEMAGKPVHRWFLPVFITINAVAILSFGFTIHFFKDLQTTDLVRYYFLIFNTLFFLIAILSLLTGGEEKKMIRSDRIILSVGLGLMTALQAVLLFFYQENTWLALGFIFVFFGGQLLIPVYLSYFANFKPFRMVEETTRSFEVFCKHYEISPRESEIILHLCKGLTNKDISDKLFISIQTVKDHTHRIYLKTMVRNRTELASLVQKETGKQAVI